MHLSDFLLAQSLIKLENENSHSHLSHSHLSKKLKLTSQTPKVHDQHFFGHLQEKQLDQSDKYGSFHQNNQNQTLEENSDA